jgi:hypothetical protein
MFLQLCTSQDGAWLDYFVALGRPSIPLSTSAAYLLLRTALSGAEGYSQFSTDLERTAACTPAPAQLCWCVAENV